MCDNLRNIFSYVQTIRIANYNCIIKKIEYQFIVEMINIYYQHIDLFESQFIVEMIIIHI